MEIILRKKKFSYLNNFITENIKSLSNDIKFINSFLIKNKYMMFSCELNNKISNKKKILFNFIKDKKNIFTKSITISYIIYFYLLAKIDEKIYIVNEKIRLNINIKDNEYLINNLIEFAINLKLSHINYDLFFKDNFKSNNIIESHLNL